MQHEAENYGARYFIQMKKSYNRIIRQEWEIPSPSPRVVPEVR